jgi:hypothetical protein
MRQALATLADRLVSLVVPKTTAAACACQPGDWTYVYCYCYPHQKYHKRCYVNCYCQPTSNCGSCFVYAYC